MYPFSSGNSRPKSGGIPTQASSIIKELAPLGAATRAVMPLQTTTSTRVTGMYDPAQRAQELMPIADKMVAGIFGGLKPPPGYGDSVTALNLAQNRAGQVLNALYHLMNQDQWAQQYNQKLQEQNMESQRVVQDTGDPQSNRRRSRSRYPYDEYDSPGYSTRKGFHIVNPWAIAAGPPGTFMGKPVSGW